jgi:hypothetical protein
MKRPLHFQPGYWLLVLLACALVTGALEWRHSRKRAGGLKLGAPDNPQDFYVWSTTSTSAFAYSFRYDPRAADEWLFHSGAWLLTPTLPHPIDSTNQDNPSAGDHSR